MAVRHPGAHATLTGSTLVLLLVALMGCGGSSGGTIRPAETSGYAANAQAETDRATQLFLPAVVTDLGARVHIGTVGFSRCDVEGWRYQAQGDLFVDLGPAPDTAAISASLAEVMQEQDLEVETRDDGSVVGRKGPLSVLVDAPTGPPARTFLHYAFTNKCAGYSEDDAAYAEDAPRTDHTAYVPPQALYTP